MGVSESLCVLSGPTMSGIWFVCLLMHLAGYCLVGWKLTVSRRCYRYYGGIATYSEARSICALENAAIVKPNNLFWVEIGKVVQYSQQVRWLQMFRASIKLCFVYLVIS